jgi:hypothetical protein
VTEAPPPPASAGGVLAEGTDKEFLGDRPSRPNYQGSTSAEDLEKIDFD